MYKSCCFICFTETWSEKDVKRFVNARTSVVLGTHLRPPSVAAIAGFLKSFVKC